MYLPRLVANGPSGLIALLARLGLEGRWIIDLLKGIIVVQSSVMPPYGALSVVVFDCSSSRVR